MRPDGPRENYAGPESGPQPPFPIKLQGPVIKGFGRGSKELGIPTANIPPEGLTAYPDLSTGVYFGYTSLRHPPSPPSTSTTTTPSPSPAIYPSVLSIGYNPFYANKTRSIEIHILHKFPADFYGSALNLLILGFIRPEYDYVSKESLIEDILVDCQVAERSLQRERWRVGSGEGWEAWLSDYGWAEGLTSKEIERVEERVLAKGDEKL